MIVYSSYGNFEPMSFVKKPSASGTPVKSQPVKVVAAPDKVIRIVKSPGSSAPASGEAGYMTGNLTQLAMAMEELGLTPREFKYKEPRGEDVEEALLAIGRGLGMAIEGTPSTPADPLWKLKVIDLVMRKSQRIKDWVAASQASYIGKPLSEVPPWFARGAKNVSSESSGESSGVSQSALTSGGGGTREGALTEDEYGGELPEVSAGAIEWVKANPGKTAGIAVGGVLVIGGLAYLLK